MKRKIGVLPESSSSFADTVAVVVSCQCTLFHFSKISRRFLFATTKTLRKSVLQNSVRICTSIFSESEAQFITVDRQTKLVSIFRTADRMRVQKYGLPRSHQKNIYGLAKSAKNRQNSLLLGDKGVQQRYVRFFFKKQTNHTENIRAVNCGHLVVRYESLTSS